MLSKENTSYMLPSTKKIAPKKDRSEENLLWSKTNLPHKHKSDTRLEARKAKDMHNVATLATVANT